MAALRSEGRRRSSSVAICCLGLAALIAGVYGNCDKPPRMEYAELLEKFLSLEEFPVGTSVTYKCRPGYIQRSRFIKPTIKCLDTLQWAEMAEFCQLKDCGNPGEPQNGRVEVPDGDFHTPNTKFGSTVTFFCDTGFKLVGRKTRTCTAIGWSNAIPQCEPAVCPPPSEIANGRHTGYGQEEYYYLTAVTYSCNAEYMELIGSRLIHCTETGDWSDPAPVCKDRRCPEPVVKNGRKVAGFKSLYLLGNVVEFMCNEGFITKDPQSIRCGEKNQWEPPVPVCRPIICTKPPAIVNGSHSGMDQEEFKYQEQVTYTCDSSDLSMIGKDAIRCNEKEEWSGPAPICKDVHCKPLIFPNGTQKSIIQNLYRYKHAIILQCNEYFSPQGQHRIECNENSMWTPKPPVCKDRRCPEPVVENGRKVSGSRSPYLVDNVVEFKCNEGFLTKEPQSVRCSENNKWEPPVPVCQPVICTMPLSIVDGSHSGIDQEEFKYHEEVTYTCDSSDLSMIGADTIQCIGEGVWSGPAPRCKDVICETPTFPNGKQKSVFQYPYRYKHSITLQCNEYFSPQGQYRIECNENSMWTPKPPVCKRTSCSEPVVQNGLIMGKKRSGTPFPLNTWISVTCNNGYYNPDGETLMKCTRDFTWSKRLPTCLPITCPKPEIEHGAVNNMSILKPEEKEYRFDARVEIKCDPNYTPKGNKIIQCTNTSKWSSLPTCEPITCPEPQIQNGQIVPIGSTAEQEAKKDYRVDDKAEVHCDEGYVPYGKKEITCLSDSSWSSRPTCDFECCNAQQAQNGQLGNVVCKNIKVEKPQSTFEVLDNITFQCNDGYVVNGKNNFQCRTNSNRSESSGCKPGKQAEFPTQTCPKFVALGKHDLNEQEVLDLNQNTNIATSPIHICQFVTKSISENWEKMELEEKYIHLQMRKLCQKIA